MSLSLAPHDIPEFGLKDSMGKFEYDAAIQYLRQSATATRIITVLNGCNWPIWVYVTQLCPPMFVEYEYMNSKFKIPAALVIWDPVDKITAFTTVPILQSPAMGLIHELGHAVQWVKNRGWYLAYVNQTRNGDPGKIGTPAYNSKLIIENDNIKMHETPVAKELGEGTRSDYNSASNYGEAQKNYKFHYILTSGQSR